MHDLIIVGGGIAGSLAASMAEGLDTVWVHPVADSEIQSLQWHGYLHRGYLYDPSVESGLIELLRRNVPFWASLDGSELVSQQRSSVVTPVRSHRRDSLPEGVRARPGIPSAARQTKDYVWLESDEQICDGPLLLERLSRLAKTHLVEIDARVLELTQHEAHWEVLLADGQRGNSRLKARRVILAIGAGSLRIPATLPATIRHSRMLVLEGEHVPSLSAISPGPELGGLFMVSRSRGGRNALLISDAYSTWTLDPTFAVDAWWSCSVLERIARLLDPSVFELARVAAYRATKAGFATCGAVVPATAWRTAPERLIHLLPSKWSLAPLAAAQALERFFTTFDGAEGRLMRLSDRLRAMAGPPADRRTEAWELAGPSLPLSALLRPSFAALTNAETLYSAQKTDAGSL